MGAGDPTSPPASGSRSGRPPGYFVVREESRAWSRTVAAMTEQLHVHREGSELHADHALRLWGRPFLRLHYAMLPV